MKDNTSKSEKLSNILSKALFESAIKTLIQDGSLSTEDINDKEKFKKKVLDITKKSAWELLLTTRII